MYDNLYRIDDKTFYLEVYDRISDKIDSIYNKLHKSKKNYERIEICDDGNDNKSGKFSKKEIIYILQGPNKFLNLKSIVFINVFNERATEAFFDISNSIPNLEELKLNIKQMTINYKQISYRLSRLNLKKLELYNFNTHKEDHNDTLLFCKSISKNKNLESLILSNCFTFVNYLELIKILDRLRKLKVYVSQYNSANIENFDAIKKATSLLNLEVLELNYDFQYKYLVKEKYLMDKLNLFSSSLKVLKLGRFNFQNAYLIKKIMIFCVYMKNLTELHLDFDYSNICYSSHIIKSICLSLLHCSKINHLNLTRLKAHNFRKNASLLIKNNKNIKINAFFHNRQIINGRSFYNYARTYN